MFHSSRPLDPSVSPYILDIKSIFLGSSPGGQRFVPSKYTEGKGGKDRIWIIYFIGDFTPPSSQVLLYFSYVSLSFFLTLAQFLWEFGVVEVLSLLWVKHNMTDLLSYLVRGTYEDDECHRKKGLYTTEGYRLNVGFIVLFDDSLTFLLTEGGGGGGITQLRMGVNVLLFTC